MSFKKGDPFYVDGGVIKPIDDNQVCLPMGSQSKPSLAFGDGDSGFYEIADDYIRVSLAGSDSWYFGSTYYGIPSGKYPVMWSKSSTGTIPVFGAYDDPNTGLGSAGDDIFSAIAGGVEGIRITEAAGGITVNVAGIQNYTDNAAAITGGLTSGDLYRNGDSLNIVH